MQLQSGTHLKRGDYRIISTLGRGGFGITYLAEQVNLHRMVCIKEFLALLDNVEPVVKVLVADDEKTKIVTPQLKPQPKVKQPKVQIGRKPKLKLKTERPKRRWWLWLLGVLLVGGVLSMLGGNEESTQKIKTYKVGDYYNENGKQGVVFEVWDGGRHGKIVSLDGAKKQWCTDGQYKQRIELGLTDKKNGKVNTDEVMKRYGSDQYPAFVWCRNKGADWYLPAKDELKAISNNMSAINSTLAEHGGTELRGDDWYWSSTESSEDAEFCAWFVGMYDGYTNYYYKCNDKYVRAVSAF